MAARDPSEKPDHDAPAEDLFGAPPPKTAKSPKPEDMAAGHRQRLRARFATGGADAVADYELLELLLFRAIPRRDVKPIAKRLIARFGDVAGALAAPPERLREIEGLGDAAIQDLKIVEAAAHACARIRLAEKPLLSDIDAVIDYCQAVMARQPIEQFRVFFLDAKNKLIADERLTQGTVDQTAVYPREVVKRALELSASAVIVAHNHPSGDPSPSKADLEMTKRLVAAADAVGVAIHDHVIIGADDAVSLREEGLM